MIELKKSITENLKSKKQIKIVIIISAVVAGIIIAIGIIGNMPSQKNDEKAIEATIQNYFNALQELNIDRMIASWEPKKADTFKYIKDGIVGKADLATDLAVDLVLDLIPLGKTSKNIASLLTSFIAPHLSNYASGMVKDNVDISVTYDIDYINIDADTADVSVSVALGFNVPILGEQEIKGDYDIVMTKISGNWYISAMK